MAVIDSIHIVKEFRLGNTRIKIADDYCREKTPEDVEKILQRIARTSKAHLNTVMLD